MAFVVPYAGQVYLLDQLARVELAESADWVLRLFQSDTDILIGTVIGDVTECNYSGYSAQPLARADWAEAQTVGDRAVTSWVPGPVWFVPTSGSQDVYGWYVTDADNEVLLFASRLQDAPWELTLSNPLPITPVMRLGSEFIPS